MEELPLLWFANRATGITVLLLLTATTVLGVLAQAGRVGGLLPGFVRTHLHRNIAVMALVFLAVHIATAVIDDYVSISVADALIPFISSYQRWWLGLGTLATDLLIAVAITTAVRHRIGLRTWRAVHLLGYVAWVVALFHGIGMGTDATKTWEIWLNGLCIAAVAVAFLVRVTMANRPEVAT